MSKQRSGDDCDTPPDDTPHKKDELGTPEWEDDTSITRFRLHIHDGSVDDAEYRHTIERYKFTDDSEDDATILTDTIVDLEKIR